MNRPAGASPVFSTALEKYYGKLKPMAPRQAYEMIGYTNCGYPANDGTCSRGFRALTTVCHSAMGGIVWELGADG